MKKLFPVLASVVLICGYISAQTPYDNFAPEQGDKEILQLPVSQFQISNVDLNDSVRYATFNADSLIFSFFRCDKSLIRSVIIKPLESKFLTVDRFAEKYPWQSPYCYASNNPIMNLDINGDSAWPINNQWNSKFISGYQNFISTQVKQYIKNGNEYTCEDFALSLLIDYASQNGLPVTIVNGTGSYNARSDAYTDIETFKNDVLTRTAARDLQRSSNTSNLNVSKAKSGDVILNINSQGNAHHTQVVFNYNPQTGSMGIVQGNSGAMNIIPGASSVFGAGNPNSFFYTGQPIEVGSYNSKSNIYRNFSTGNTINNYSQTKNINFRRWQFYNF